MNWETWWVFVVMETVLCLTPGPAVLLVLSQALARGAKKSVFASFGILAANALYFLLSATGVGAVLAASHNLFLAIKWIGAGYLIYLGVSSFFGKHSIVPMPESGAFEVSNPRTFANGFILQVANPKALLFFTALLPQFINPRQPVALQVAILGGTSIVVEFFILLGYGVLAGKASEIARQPRFATVTNRIAGVLLAGAGAGLAVLDR
jgi:threonine/homoserine/homoserine lactone efflux protein